MGFSNNGRITKHCTAYTFTATTPITHTWSPAPDSGQGTSSAGYAWATEGVKTITVTAANAGGAVSDTHAITITGLTVRVITYTYDALGRLVEAGYSSGERFEYTYDAAGNRTAMTSTTPLSGTLVTTYTYDAANRLTDRAASDGRTYTYTWSARGQLLAEWTQGYPVRTFSYNAAGQMISATVFTLTTHFTYNGDGARVAVSVEGHGTTTYTLDYAAGNRILAETSSEGTKLYLYGHECLGEFADLQTCTLASCGWLYYLPDATGYVRQATDEQGQVVSAWLYDPDGTVLEGPEGPVSHLVCGGVYDWSTGLIHKDGRYFDPILGIWLALAPLIVVQSWRGRKRKRRGWPWYVMVVLVVVGVGGTLVACGPSPTPTPGPAPTPTCTEIPPSAEKYVAYWAGKERDGTCCYDAAFYVSYLVHKDAFEAHLAPEEGPNTIEDEPYDYRYIYLDEDPDALEKHPAEDKLNEWGYTKWPGSDIASARKGDIVLFYWLPIDYWDQPPLKYRDRFVFHAAVVWNPTMRSEELFEKIGCAPDPPRISEARYQLTSFDGVKSRLTANFKPPNWTDEKSGVTYPEGDKLETEFWTRGS